jgi:hypothetical protein
MLKKSLIILPLLFLGMASYTQVSSSDTTKKKEKVEDWAIDSTIDYDLLLQDMETFLDSISSPHSYLLGSFAMGSGYFNYTSKSTTLLETRRDFTYIPTLGYYHKSGLSLNTTGNIITENSKPNLYQIAVSPGMIILKTGTWLQVLPIQGFLQKTRCRFILRLCKMNCLPTLLIANGGSGQRLHLVMDGVIAQIMWKERS